MVAMAAAPGKKKKRERRRRQSKDFEPEEIADLELDDDPTGELPSGYGEEGPTGKIGHHLKLSTIATAGINASDDPQTQLNKILASLTGNQSYLNKEQEEVIIIDFQVGDEVEVLYQNEYHPARITNVSATGTSYDILYLDDSTIDSNIPRRRIRATKDTVKNREEDEPTVDDVRDPENAAICKKWKEGSKVEIYSNSKDAWYNGSISTMFADRDGEWLVVDYEVTPGNIMQKQIQRADTDVRPASADLHSGLPQNPDTWTRQEWKVGDKAQIYSSSNMAWFDAQIKGIKIDGDGEWLSLQYVVDDAVKGEIQMDKDVDRFGDELRPYIEDLNRQWRNARVMAALNFEYTKDEQRTKAGHEGVHKRFSYAAGLKSTILFDGDHKTTDMPTASVKAGEEQTRMSRGRGASKPGLVKRVSVMTRGRGRGRGRGGRQMI